MEDLTKKQQEAYQYFLNKTTGKNEKYVADRYTDTYTAISMSIIYQLIKKGYLININPKRSAFSRALYRAILKNAPPNEQILF